MYEVRAVYDTGPIDGSGESYWDVLVDEVLCARVPAGEGIGPGKVDGREIADRIGRMLVGEEV